MKKNNLYLSNGNHDPHLVLGDERDSKMEEYMTLVLRIGVTCSIESPIDCTMKQRKMDFNNKL